jgi:hypothetical protein
MIHDGLPNHFDIIASHRARTVKVPAKVPNDTALNKSTKKSSRKAKIKKKGPRQSA